MKTKITNSKKKKIISISFIIILACCFCGYFFYDKYSTQYENVPYSNFYENLESGNIDKVDIKNDSIIFQNIKENKVYKTVNPKSPLLEEKIRQTVDDVKVEKEKSEIFSIISDLIFYILIAVVFIFFFKRFIGPTRFKVVHKTGVKFSDIVGMDKLKQDMLQVMDIMQHSKEYSKKGMRLPKGILLVGEPGNGKTLFAKALAGEAKINLIPTKATDFESMFMSIGPMKVKLLFSKARRMAPCILFIDEFDGIGTTRNYNGSAIETENTRIVTALLNELDGFEDTNGIMVIAATNSIEALDPALIRPGRFDVKFTVPYPDFNAREQLVEKYSKDKKYSESCKPAILAKMFDGFSCAKIESVLNRAALLAAQRGAEEFTLEDVRLAVQEV